MSESLEAVCAVVCINRALKRGMGQTTVNSLRDEDGVVRCEFSQECSSRVVQGNLKVQECAKSGVVALIINKSMAHPLT